MLTTILVFLVQWLEYTHLNSLYCYRYELKAFLPPAGHNALLSKKLACSAAIPQSS